jgi:hypothetical protein
MLRNLGWAQREGMKDFGIESIVVGLELDSQKREERSECYIVHSAASPRCCYLDPRSQNVELISPAGR